MLTPHLIHRSFDKDGKYPYLKSPVFKIRVLLPLARIVKIFLLFLMGVPAAFSETSTLHVATLEQAQIQAQERINLPVYEGIDSVIAPFNAITKISNFANTTAPVLTQVSNTAPTLIVKSSVAQNTRTVEATNTVDPNAAIKRVTEANNIAADVSPKLRLSTRIKPLLVAIKTQQNTNTNNELIVARIDPNSKSNLEREQYQSFDLRPINRDQASTMLLQAIINNDNSKAYALLMRGADINSRDRWGWTALLNATIKGNLEMVNFLLERGANPNIAGNDGRAPIIAASWNGYPAIVASLINADANVNLANRDGWTALSCAAWNGDIATTRLLLSAAADKTIQTYERQSAIQLAMERGHQEVISLLK